ncbi:MAG TPA: MaoC family dehydratase [Gemmatimonadales bacterium]|jgi:acyl dehydratase
MPKPVLPHREPLYLEDLEVGRRFISRPYAVTAEEAHGFAAAYDPQAIHLDDQAARASLFQGMVVSGWFTAAVSMRLFVEEGPPIAGGSIGLGGEISWPRPTRPGDTLRVTSEILGVTPSRSRRDRGIVTIRNETLNQRGEVVQTFTGKLLVPRRTAPRGQA